MIYLVFLFYIFEILFEKFARQKETVFNTINSIN